MGSFSNKTISKLWAKSNLIIWQDTYRMIAFELSERKKVFDLMSKIDFEKHYSSFISDHHEIAIILPDEVWSTQKEYVNQRDEFGPLKCITFDVPLDITVSGYLKPAITVLANANISVVPQCALIYDHIFVTENKLDHAVELLKKLQSDAKGLCEN